MTALVTPNSTLCLSPEMGRLTTAAPGQLAPVVEMARRCCGLLRRPCYSWQRAAVTPGCDLEEEASGVAADQNIIILVPARLPGSDEFLFELVQEAGKGPWRMCFAFGKQLTELSSSQLAMASSFLVEHTGSGVIKPYWE